MHIKTSAENRKSLMKMLSIALGEKPHYNGAPSFSYNIGEKVRVERDGTIVTDDLEAWEYMMPVFETYKCASEAREQAQREKANLRPAKNKLISDEPAVVFMVPFESLTPRKLLNLIRTLFARQNLICAMLDVMDPQFINMGIVGWMLAEHNETVQKMLRDLEREIAAGNLKGIHVTPEFDLEIRLRYNTKPDLKTMQIHKQFLGMVVDHALNARSACIDAVSPAVGELKYYCYQWIMMLGARGPEYAELRDTLVGHLDGYCTFKSVDKMHAHANKITERRRAEREKRRKEYVEPEDFVYDDRPSRSASRR